MNIAGIFILLKILTAWSILAVLFEILKKKTEVLKSYRDASWVTLGILGVIMLGITFFEWGIPYISGYVYEQMAFFNKTMGNISIIYIGLEILLPIIISLNVFKKSRNNNKLRAIQIVCISLYLIINFWIFGMNGFQFSTTIMPGWHTTIVSVGDSFGILIWLVIILILNLLIAKFTKKTVSL